MHINTRHNVATISTSACTTTTQHIARHFLFWITAATMLPLLLLLLCVRHTVPKYKQKKLNPENRPKNYSVTKHTHTRAHSLTHTTHRSFRVRVYAHIVAGHQAKGIASVVFFALSQQAAGQVCWSKRWARGGGVKRAKIRHFCQLACCLPHTHAQPGEGSVSFSCFDFSYRKKRNGASFPLE